MSSSAVYILYTSVISAFRAFWYDSYGKHTFYIWAAVEIEKWIPVAMSLVVHLFEMCDVYQNNVYH